MTSTSKPAKLFLFSALLALGTLFVACVLILEARLGLTTGRIGAPVLAALFIGIQLKTGKLLIGRSWDRVVTTRDGRPTLYWAVVMIEGLTFLAGTFFWRT